MSDRQIHGLTASREEDPVWSRATGRVTVRAFASWLKGAPLTTASLTPSEARKLAISLLVAADEAEAKR